MSEREQILRELQRLAEKFDDDREARDSERGRDLVRVANLEDVVRQHGELLAALRAAQVESRSETIETRALRQHVERLLERDVGQEARLAALEAHKAAAGAELAGEEAKSGARSTSRRWSAAGTVLGTIVAAAIASGFQQCGAPAERTPTYQPRH